MGGPETFGGVIDKYYDNSYDNIGNKTSFVWYGKSTSALVNRIPRIGAYGGSRCSVGMCGHGTFTCFQEMDRRGWHQMSLLGPIPPAYSPRRHGHKCFYYSDGHPSYYP